MAKFREVPAVIDAPRPTLGRSAGALGLAMALGLGLAWPHASATDPRPDGAAVGTLAGAAVLGTAAGVALLPTHAFPSRLAGRSLMLDIARAGDRLVSVGERGRVLLSDDSGKSWRQSAGVPVAVTLTAVVFVDARSGWATGHAGVVLHTADAGESWQLQLDGARAAQLALAAVSARPADDPARRAARQLVADGPDKPFLAVEFTGPLAGTVVGAYGLIFSTEDGGQTWLPRLTDTDNPGGLHLNAVHSVGTTTFIAGEKGLLLRREAGGRFVAVASPYDGSWFTVDAVPGAVGSSSSSALVVAGLRGHAYLSEDQGATWQKLELPSGATLSRSARVGKGLLLLVDQAGAVFALDGSRRLVPLALPPGAPLTALALAADGSVVATTLRGPVRLPLDLSLPLQTSASR